MDDATMGVGLILFPQMYQSMVDQCKKDGGDGEKEPKLVAVCPHCGTVNDFPYKFCKECGKRPEIPRDVAGDAFKVCPYCGKDLDLPKRPNYCPYCTERLT